MGKIVWNSVKDKYEAIGYLARPGVINCIEVMVPENKLDLFKTQFEGKYTSEFPYLIKSESKYGFQFRINLQDVEGCPEFLAKQLDEKYQNRINDTKFIRELVEDFGFTISHFPQNTTRIKELVYEKCKTDKNLAGCKKAFDKGFSVYEDFLSALEVKIKNKVLPMPKINSNTAKKETKRKATVRNNFVSKSVFSSEQLLKLGWIGEEYFYKSLLQDDGLKKMFDISGPFETDWFNKDFDTEADWQDKSVGKGCDMVISTSDRVIYVEIKSSKRKQPVFVMTSKEMQCMEKMSDCYYVVKIDFLEKLVKGSSPEITVFKEPYKAFFKPKKMREATFIIGE